MQALSTNDDLGAGQSANRSGRHRQAAAGSISALQEVDTPTLLGQLQHPKRVQRKGDRRHIGSPANGTSRSRPVSVVPRTAGSSRQRPDSIAIVMAEGKIAV
jgi:hypothetical protein